MNKLWVFFFLLSPVYIQADILDDARATIKKVQGAVSDQTEKVNATLQTLTQQVENLKRDLSSTRDMLAKHLGDLSARKVAKSKVITLLSSDPQARATLQAALTVQGEVEDQLIYLRDVVLLEKGPITEVFGLLSRLIFYTNKALGQVTSVKNKAVDFVTTASNSLLGIKK